MHNKQQESVYSEQDFAFYYKLVILFSDLNRKRAPEMYSKSTIEVHSVTGKLLENQILLGFTGKGF